MKKWEELKKLIMEMNRAQFEWFTFRMLHALSGAADEPDRRKEYQ